MKTVDEICEFLGTRDAIPATIVNFRENKIDGNIVQFLNDDKLRDIGMTALGDRVMLRRFCGCPVLPPVAVPEAVLPSTSLTEQVNPDNKRRKLLDLLRSTCGRKAKLKPANNQTGGRPKKSSRKVNFGLRLNAGDKDENGYRISNQVKSPLGDKNTIVLAIETSAEYEVVLGSVKDAFFPNGMNPVIGEASYTMEIVNGRNENVSAVMKGKFCIYDYTEQQKVPGAIRLYLLCSDPCADTAEDPDPDYLPDLKEAALEFDPTSPSGEVWLRRNLGECCMPLATLGPATTVSGPAATVSGPAATVSGSCTYREYSCIVDISSDEDVDDADLQVALQASLLQENINSGLEQDLPLTYWLRTLESNIKREEPPNMVNVVRGRLLDGAVRAMQRKMFNPCRPLSVKFMDDNEVSEGAIDQGGPKNEFFTFLIHELGKSQMFHGEHSKMINLSQSAIQKDMYYVAGLIIVLSLAHGCRGPHFFSDTLYDLVTRGFEHMTPEISDIESPRTRQLLEHINNAKSMEELYTAMDDASTILEIAGCNIPVKTIEDKTKILNFTIKFYAVHRVRHCIDRFIDGLSTFGFIDILRANPYRFRLLFCEPPEQPTAKIMEELFKPLLSCRESNAYKMEVVARGFWNDFLIDVEAGETKLKVKDILMFATGCEIVPPCGFDTSPQLEFLKDGKYPSSNTCGAVMRIPLRYQTYEEFTEAMAFGILNSPGFGTA